MPTTSCGSQAGKGESAGARKGSFDSVICFPCGCEMANGEWVSEQPISKQVKCDSPGAGKEPMGTVRTVRGGERELHDGEGNDKFIQVDRGMKPWEVMVKGPHLTVSAAERHPDTYHLCPNVGMRIGWSSRALHRPRTLYTTRTLVYYHSTASAPPTASPPGPTSPTRLIYPRSRPSGSRPPDSPYPLPPGYTIYPNHHSNPSHPFDMSKTYTSPHPDPPLPRSLIFDYLFPPDAAKAVYPVPPDDTPAFIDGVTGRTLTRGQLRDQCLQVAAGLGNLGVKRGDVVCLFGMNSLEYVVGMLGCQAAGAIVSPANYG